MLKQHILPALLLPALMMSTMNASAAGGFLDGNKLYEYAKSYQRLDSSSGSTSDLPNASFFLGYITASSDTFNNAEQICVPPNVSTSQLADVVYQYLRDNPDQRQYTASSNVYVAFTRAFPDSSCK